MSHKIKLITGDDRLRVENTMNQFIKEVGDNNIDYIEFSTATKNNGPNHPTVLIYSCMVYYYKEEE